MVPHETCNAQAQQRNHARSDGHRPQSQIDRPHAPHGAPGPGMQQLQRSPRGFAPTYAAALVRPLVFLSDFLFLTYHRLHISLLNFLLATTNYSTPPLLIQHSITPSIRPRTAKLSSRRATVRGVKWRGSCCMGRCTSPCSRARGSPTTAGPAVRRRSSSARSRSLISHLSSL